MERAKELFYKYHGNHFYMDREGEGREYDSYRISKETEEMWTKELIGGFLESKQRGREALRTYSAVTDLIGADRGNEDWNACLYYPLRTEVLDDVTILYMLPCSFCLAERAAKKHLFSKAEAEAYEKELDNCIRSLICRAEKGETTRSEDYVMQEFSDPVYVADYLNSLEKKWAGLFR